MLSIPALASSCCIGTGWCTRSFLALLLCTSPQEVVRDPAYRSRGEAVHVERRTAGRDEDKVGVLSQGIGLQLTEGAREVRFERLAVG
jgi:hypothetical protein